MRSQLSVCVFCASRIARLATQSTRAPQRRHLQSSGATSRPAAAGAQREDTTRTGDIYSTQQRESTDPQSPNSRDEPAPRIVDDGLTEEEREIKKALRTAERERRHQPLHHSVVQTIGRSNGETQDQTNWRWETTTTGQGSTRDQSRWSMGLKPKRGGDALPNYADGFDKFGDLPGALGTLSQGLFNGSKEDERQRSPEVPRFMIRKTLGDPQRKSGSFQGMPLASLRLPWGSEGTRRQPRKPWISASSASKEDDAVANHWQHVRRTGRPQPTENDDHTIRVSGQLPQSEDSESTRRQQERLQRQRQHSTGSFVGFDEAATKTIEESRENMVQYSPYRPITSAAPSEENSSARSQLQDFESTGTDRFLRATSQRDMSSAISDAFITARASKYGPRENVPMEYVSRKADRKRGEYQDRKTVRRQESEQQEDDDDELATRIERKRQRKLEKQARKEAMAAPTPILLPDFISIGNLASALRVRVESFTNKLTELGFPETNNDHVIDAETAGLIASEFNFDPILPTTSIDEDIVALSRPDDQSLLMSRPPVITIMGHVDHGKTTLLDWLRKSSVAASEHGGITQHIGAFTVPMPSGRTITFLDTPGHAAFLSMRARGANVTDIVILVVAADDSVKPQTIEAIKHAREAGVPMIVAINKIDKEDANPEKVKQDLARYNVEVEDYGGDTQTVNVSGKTGEGMETLEEAAVALADVLDVRADTTGQVEAWVLEATRKSSGKVATLLVRRGTLTPGTILVAGSTWTRVRTLRNEAGAVVNSAGPGTPVEVDGWREQPDAGAEALEAPDEQRARRVVDLRLERAETVKLSEDVIAVNESRRAEEEKRAAEAEAAKNIEDGGKPTGLKVDSIKLNEVPLIVRADVSGSVEALTASILGLGNAEVRPSLLRSDVGPLSPSDIEHAAIAKGHVVSFNVPVDKGLRATAERQGVKIIDGSVIYRIVDDVKVLLEEKLPPLISQRVTGEALVAQDFEIGLGGSKKLKVAGCRVSNGVIDRKAKVRVLRGGETVYDGTLFTLKNHKKDVNEMRKGTECGLSFDGFLDFLIGDQVQCYEVVSEKRTL